MITKADNITKNKYYIFVKANLFFATIMKDEPQYSGKEGVVEYIDDIGQIHVVGGGCALIPEIDEFAIISDR